MVVRGDLMDFTYEQLKQNAALWNYDRAAALVKECERLLSESSVLRSRGDTFTRILSESYSKAVITTKEILTLLFNGYPEGAMALARILYESMVVMRFLYGHKNDEELLTRYIDDFYVKVSRDRVKYYSYILEYSQDEEEKANAQKQKSAARKEHNKLKQKYSEYLSYNKQSNYLHDYWWIGDVLPTRSFGAIQNEMTLENLKILYVLSCYRAHSGVVGNAVRFGTMLDESQISARGSLDGFQVPLCFSLVCFGILTETTFDSTDVDCREVVDEIEKLIAPFEDYLYR